MNEYYEVNLYKGTFYKDTEELNIGPILKDEVPVRIFPLQKNNNEDNNKYQWECLRQRIILTI